MVLPGSLLWCLVQTLPVSMGPGHLSPVLLFCHQESLFWTWAHLLPKLNLVSSQAWSCPSSFWRPAYSQQDSLPHAFQTCLPFRSPVPCGLHSLWDGWGESFFLKIVDFNSSLNMLSLDPYKIYKALSYLTSDFLNSVLWSISGFYIWPSSLTHSSVSGHASRFAVWWLILINHSIGLRVTKEEGFPYTAS